MDLLFRLLHRPHPHALLEPRALAGLSPPSASRGAKPASAPPGAGGLVLLAHGAGGHKDHPHMLALAGMLAETGLEPVRFDFPYRAEGRGFPDKLPVLVESFRKQAERALAARKPRYLILAGHSLGSRAALALAAAGHPCRGLILFSYPLHPPGKPEKLRLDNLDALPAPVLSLSGTRDAFCTREILDKLRMERSGKSPWRHHWLEGADHAWAVPKRMERTRAEVLAEAGAECAAWLSALPKA